MNCDRKEPEPGMLPNRNHLCVDDVASCASDPCSSCGVVAVDVGATKVAASLVVFSPSGKPRVMCPCVIPSAGVSGSDMETAADVVAQAVCMVLDAAHAGSESDEGCSMPPRKAVGIGIAARGQVDPYDGSILDDGNLLPGWKGTPIASLLEKRFLMPVAVINDAQAHALGEVRWGAGRNASSCLLVACGTGLGGGIVIDGRLVRGAHGAAGHIGHTLHPQAAGSACSCARLSHIESIASGSGIEAMYRALSSAGPEAGDTPDGAEIACRAHAGEATACTVLQQAGYALGEAIGSWVNAIDPGLVILSGSVCGAGPLWRASLDEGFASQVLDLLADTPIVIGRLGCDAALVGAAEFLLDALSETDGLFARA